MGERGGVISSVLIHLLNDQPVVADLEDLPGAADRLVRCTNVRTIDGKRPAFVHDRHSTFVFPIAMIRFIEVPQISPSSEVATQDEPSTYVSEPPPMLDTDDEDAGEDLLARIRQI